MWNRAFHLRFIAGMPGQLQPPSLPTELVTDVIHLAVEITSGTLELSHLLYATSLVSRTWHTISQPFLDASPVGVVVEPRGGVPGGSVIHLFPQLQAYGLPYRLSL